MKIIKVKDYEELSEKACEFLAEQLADPSVNVVGLATGGTPLGVYKKMVELYNNEKISFQHIHTLNLDEYVGLPQWDFNSYHQYMCRHLFNHIDIPFEQTHIPSGVAANLEEECRQYEKLIRDLGGVDIQLLGIGSNGHIGFNEPGTPFDTKTHIVDLTPSTREVNARYFDEEGQVPHRAITMGINTIMQSKKVLLIASGLSKAKALKQLIQGEEDEQIPATILQNHHDLTIIADENALNLV